MANYQRKTRSRSDYLRSEKEVVRKLTGLTVQIANGRIDPDDEDSDHNVVETLKFTGRTSQKQALLKLKEAQKPTLEEKMRYISGCFRNPKFKPGTKEVINPDDSKVGGFYCFTPVNEAQALALGIYAGPGCKVEVGQNFTFANRAQASAFVGRCVMQEVEGCESFEDSEDLINFIYLADRKGWKQSKQMNKAGW